MAHLPDDTFHYDDLTPLELDEILDQIKMFNELKKNILYKDFMQQRQLSRLFAPIATFDKPGNKINEEFVAMMEGVKDPFFGIAYSIDKVQFNFNIHFNDKVDHSRYSLKHSQKLANFFVDEARISPNSFKSKQKEKSALIENFDSEIVDFIGDDGQVRKTEVYIFE